MATDPATLTPGPLSIGQMRSGAERQLFDNILPFWMEHAADHQNGGFYGALTNDLRVLNDVPRSAVLCARMLWTYAAAYRAYGNQRFLPTAQWAYRYLTETFWDSQHGGVYWLVDWSGKPVEPRKHCYAQAFAIYGLAEYYRATGEPGSLALAQQLFWLLERHAYEPTGGGYIEGCAADWGPLGDMRLSQLEPNSRKSMNTLLHLMEAYTSLLPLWEEPRLRERLRELVKIFLDHIIDPYTRHFRLFFDDSWNSSANAVSFGHDIEGSWLLVEAAEALGEPELLAQARSVAVEMAWAVYSQGMDADGSLLNEGRRHSDKSTDKEWWVQAEALVGFINAYQISGYDQFARAALSCWQFIETHLVDRENGDWFKVLNRQGQPYDDRYKVGPWECPYHHTRACMELLRRCT